MSAATSELQTINGDRTVITTLDQTHVALFKASDGTIHIEIQDESDADCVVSINTFGIRVSEDWDPEPWTASAEWRGSTDRPPVLASRISDESMEDIIDTAGYGISYWATSATSGGGQYEIECDDHPTDKSNPTVVISEEEIRKAFWAIAMPGQTLVNGTLHGYAQAAMTDGEGGDIDAGHVDAHLADAIIQVAAFGEIVFG